MSKKEMSKSFVEKYYGESTKVELCAIEDKINYSWRKS